MQPLLADPKRPFVHRDLSWLHFNERVLAEAKSESVPLLERLKFLGITSSNLDEFFMIRIASLESELNSLKKFKKKTVNLKRMENIRTEIIKSVHQFHQRQNLIFNKLRKGLFDQKVFISRKFQSSQRLTEVGEQIFFSEVAPELPEPEDFFPEHLKDLLNLQTAVIFRGRKWLKFPKDLQPVHWIEFDEGEYALFFTDDLIRYFVKKAYGFKGAPILLRLTRDADVTVDMEDEDTSTIPSLVRKQIRSRDSGRPIRLQVSGNFDYLSKQFLSENLKIDREQIYKVNHPLLLHGAFGFANQLAKESRFKKKVVYPSFQPLLPKTLEDPSRIFSKIRQRDYFLHHPYDSFDAFINFVEAAADDPNVTSIQQTVYRVDALSRVVELLKKAAKTKKVRVFIEPRARFDEIRNIKLAEELRSAGAEVDFSFSSLKLHAKVALVSRRENGRTVYYTHLSTGNYNAKTARLYTDMAILTANRHIGNDARLFFDCVYQEKTPQDFSVLEVAPTRLHRRLLSLIHAETAAAKAGKEAGIFAKVNTLVDENVVNSLYDASKAGVKIDLNVRGACSLIPGIKNLSENIRVLSIVDRFLEHSRIYYFKNSDIIYLSSADWMPRNFFKRLELAFPILDERIASFIKSHVIPTYLNDHVKAWNLSRRGLWRRRKASEATKDSRAQWVFQELAEKHYEGTGLT